MSIRVRSLGSRRRCGGGSLVRSIPAGVAPLPANPWLGSIARFCKPTLVADYHDVATGSWSTGSFYDCYKYSPSVQFGGDLWTCNYHVLSVPESTDEGEESSVILPPIRLTVCEPSAADGPTTTWQKDQLYVKRNALSGSILISAYGGGMFAQDTFLPVSGNSHVADGKPTLLQAELHLWHETNQPMYHAMNSLLGWSGTNAVTNPPLFPLNWHIVAKYIQLRKNGVAFGPLVDKTAIIEYRDASGDPSSYPYRLQAASLNARVVFPSMPTSFTYLDIEKENWEFDFDAGDTIEMDIWVEAKIRNWVTPETTPLLVIFTEENQTYSDRIDGTHSGSWFSAGMPLVDTNCQLGMSGLKTAYRFNPLMHTFEFTPSDGALSLGKATAPALTFDVTNQRLIWRYDTSVAGVAGVAFTVDATEDESEKTLSITFTSVEVGAIVTIHLSPGGEDFTYTSTTTNVNTFAAAIRDAIADFVLDHAAEPPWGDVSVGDVFSDTFEMTYTIDQTMSVSGTSHVDASSSWVQVELYYENEIAWMTMSTSPSLGLVPFYRPRSSGDYVTQVDDEFEGTLNCGETGVFNYMGTTIFDIWRGAQSLPYDGRKTVSADYPSSVTVKRVLQ